MEGETRAGASTDPQREEGQEGRGQVLEEAFVVTSWPRILMGTALKRVPRKRSSMCWRATQYSRQDGHSGTVWGPQNLREEREVSRVAVRGMEDIFLTSKTTVGCRGNLESWTSVPSGLYQGQWLQNIKIVKGPSGKVVEDTRILPRTDRDPKCGLQKSGLQAVCVCRGGVTWNHWLFSLCSWKTWFPPASSYCFTYLVDA